MKDVVYKGCILMRNSEAFALWDIWQKAKSDRNQAQKKLDDHMKKLDQNALELMTRYDK
jgi:hypothetical protein